MAWRGRVIRSMLVVGLSMAAGAVVFLVMTLGGSASSADSSCTINWVGPSTGGSWSTAANWDLGHIPQNGDVACASGVTGTITYSTGTTSLSELRLSAPLSITGGTLALTDTSATGNTVGGLTLGAGFVQGPGALAVNGDISWGSGGGSLITPGGTLTQPAGHTDTFAPNGTSSSINGWSVTLGSPVSMSGTITLGFSGSFTATGNVTMADGATVNNNGGGTFAVQGALTKPSGTGTATIKPAVNLTGTVEVDTGTLAITGGGTASSPMTVSSGATLGIGGVTSSSAATVSGAGTLEALDVNSTSTYNGTVNVAALTTGGNLGGDSLFNGTLTVSGTMSVTTETISFGGSGNTVGGLTLGAGFVQGPGALAVNGDISWGSGGGSLITPGGTLTQPAGHTDTFAPNGTSSSINGWSVTLGSPVSMSGTITLGFSGSFTATGNVTMADGATVNNNGGGTFAVQGALTKPSGTGTATIKPAVNLTGTGSLTVDAGTLSINSLTNLTSGGVLTGGAYTVAGGTLSIPFAITSNAATLSLGSSGAFMTGATNALTSLTNNSGSVSVSQNLTLSSALANTGSVSVLAGVLQAPSFTQTSGTTTVAGNATLKAGSGGTGSVAINGGSLTGNGTVAGNVTGSGTTTPGRASGPLTVTGTYQLGGGGALDIGVSGPSAPGTDFGQLAVSGSAAIGGALNITTANAFLPPVCTVYPIVTAASRSGTFAQVNGAALSDRQYRVDYTATGVNLTVLQPPTITSANGTSFETGQAGTFTVTTSGCPAAPAALSETGALPSGVTFLDNGDGTATLAGTPAAGTGGTYLVQIKATNGVSPDASQSFTLTVLQPPAVTSANSTTFTTGQAGTFTVTTTGFPTAALSRTGALPSGVTFTDNGDGTATLAGTPAAGAGGAYPLQIMASNGVVPNASQSFTLTVQQAPAVTSANSTTFTAGQAGTFTVTASGFPVPALSETGTLPSGVTFTDGTGSATLAGTPAAGTGGTYPIQITATNGVSPDATQSFTLTVAVPPSHLSGVSCKAANVCEAVGDTTIAGKVVTLAEGWNGTTWTVQTTPNPTGATSSTLNGVSCTSTTFCEAVGNATIGGKLVTLAEMWNGTAWKVQTTPNPTGATSSTLNGVSCISTKPCEAVGAATVAGKQVTLAEAWSGTAWKVQTTPNPTGGTGSSLNGVSCRAANACEAVGSSTVSGKKVSVAEVWATSWKLQTIPNPSGATSSALNGVSCVSTKPCEAVGTTTIAGKPAALAELWNGTSWKVQTIPGPAGATSTSLNGVSCTATTFCEAVGTTTVAGKQVTLAETWNGTTWKVQTTTNPSAATASTLKAVSCTATNFCQAVGNATIASSPSALMERWNGTAWM